METHTYHVAPAVYGFCATFSAALFVLWCSIASSSGAPWEPLAFPPVVFALCVLWMSRYHVTFGPRDVVVATPLGGARRLACSDILSVELEEKEGIAGSSAHLCIRTSYGEELRLDSRLFPHQVSQRLLALGLQSKRPGSEMRW